MNDVYPAFKMFSIPSMHTISTFASATDKQADSALRAYF